MIFRFSLLILGVLFIGTTCGLASAQSAECAPGTEKYLSLPALSYDSAHRPDFIPQWNSTPKTVDRYGREVAPLANAAKGVASARRYSEDLEHALWTASVQFWNEFDATGSVSDAIKKDYAYFIVNVWSHNGDMANLNDLIGNADAGMITGSASVQLPRGWEKIGYTSRTADLLLRASRADYLAYSSCHGRGDFKANIEGILLQRASLTEWETVSGQVAKMELDTFSESERETIMKKIIEDGRRLSPVHDVSTAEAIRGWLGTTFIDRERTKMLEFVESRTQRGNVPQTVNCSTMRVIEAANYVMDKYPLAFVENEELGLGQPIGWTTRSMSNSYSDAYNRKVYYEGLSIAIARISCDLGQESVVHHLRFEGILSRIIERHDEVQNVIDMHRPEEMSAYFTDPTELLSFTEFVAEKARRNFQVCMEATDGNLERCYCMRQTMTTLANEREKPPIRSQFTTGRTSAEQSAALRCR